MLEIEKILIIASFTSYEDNDDNFIGNILSKDKDNLYSL